MTLGSQVCARASVVLKYRKRSGAVAEVWRDKGLVTRGIGGYLEGGENLGAAFRGSGPLEGLFGAASTQPFGEVRGKVACGPMAAGGYAAWQRSAAC